MSKLNVGSTKKTGEVDSPSCNASTDLEVELDPDLLKQPDSLPEHAHRLFSLARETLGQEPNLRDAPDGRRTVRGYGQHGGSHHRWRGRRATREQMVAIHELAMRHEVDLDGLLRDRFRVCQLYELSASEARELLGGLKAMGTSTDNNVEATAD
jgi:hypothetical protein